MRHKFKRKSHAKRRKKTNQKLEKITGYRAAQIAIHKDEGHYEEGTGDFIQNVHAHVIFYARDMETGLSLSAENYRRKDLMRIMQDTVASELGMERGQSAEITGAKHMSPRAFKAQKRQEAALEKNNAEWEAKMAEKQAEWEAKLAEREAKREEWEKKIPEIIAARERRSKYICEQLDWENARTGKMLAREMQILGMNFAGIANPNGNILVEAQKHAIRNIFYMLGTTAQLAVFLMKKTLANDEKLAADVKIYNVESTLLRAVDYIANSDKANGEELKIRIKRTLMLIPEDKREELFLYALENAPTEELRNDIKALIEGRFSDIAKSEQAQKRIENRDLRQALKEYSEEVRKIRDELKQMDEENRVLNAAEGAILREKGAERDEYAEQEAENRKRLDELKMLKDEQKALKKIIDDQKQREEKDAKTIAEQAEKIAKLTKQISEITKANVAKQKELEAEKEEAEKDKIKLKDKIEELEAEKIIPQDIFDEINRVHYGIEPETLHDMAIDERDAALDERDEALKRVKELENELKQQPKPEPEPVKPEQKPEPKKDDFTNIYGYSTPKPEPRRRLDDIKPRPREDDRPKYEPEKIEPERESEPFRDPWAEIEEKIEKWKKADSEVAKKMLSPQILRDIEKYEKSGWDIPLHRQLTLDSFRRAASYDPADAINRERERELEREQKRQQAEMAIKYEEVKAKNVRAEDDARQTALRKKKKEDYEMGVI